MSNYVLINRGNFYLKLLRHFKDFCCGVLYFSAPCISMTFHVEMCKFARVITNALPESSGDGSRFCGNPAGAWMEKINDKSYVKS